MIFNLSAQAASQFPKFSSKRCTFFQKMHSLFPGLTSLVHVHLNAFCTGNNTTVQIQKSTFK